MNQNVGIKILILGNIIITLLLYACGSSPRARFYTLSSIPIQGSTEKTVMYEKNRIIAIGPIEIPEYLDRVEIVTRADNKRLIISEFDLWGGSIKTDISRVLVDNTGQLLESEGLAVIAWKTNISESYRIPVMINQLDVIPGNNLILKAQWAVLDKDGKTALSFREIIITKPVKGSDYGAIVSSMSESLGDLSKSIAENVKSIKDIIVH